MLQDNSAHAYTEEVTEPASILDKYIPARPNHAQKVKINSRGWTLTVTRKNGKYPVALLAGGPRDLAREIQLKLARMRGIFVKYHLSYERPIVFNRPLPKDIDLVICLRDMLSHENHASTVLLAKKAGVRFVRTQRKMANMLGALVAAGLGPDSLPEHTIATMKFDEDLDYSTEDLPEDEPPKFRDAPIISSPPIIQQAFLDIARREAVAVPVLGEVKAEAPLKIPTPDGLQEAVTTILEQAAAPVRIPELKKGQPSPQLACLAATLFRLCADENVSVLCTPTELSFNPAR